MVRWLICSVWLFATPSYGQNASLIYTDEDAKVVKTAMLAKADRDVRAFFAETFGQSLENSIALIGTSDPSLLNVHLSQALKEMGRRQRSSPVDAATLCDNKPIGAAANRSYTVMCWLKPKAYDREWLALIEQRLPPILAHEFTHQLQYHLANDDPPQRISGTKELLLGPSWMVEGTAEVFERIYSVQVQGKDAADTADQALFNMQTRARRSRLTLTQLTDAGSTKGRGGYGTARFAAFVLAQRNRPEDLLEYFTVLGQTKDRDVAFEKVFGLSFDKFEADFERIRRDFAAAKEYVKGQ
ncbi:MAG TPA: hypothetical protein DE314_13050 [Sulfitobacter sp.]|jgi:hypothetical protein|nr:hypothetical protein [Sulfitobacter sp.]